MVLAFAAGRLPANAHARFEGSTPASGAELQTPPADVTIRFDDAVTIDALHVLDVAGSDVETGVPYHPAGNTHDAAVAVPALARGAYTVIWEIVADDGHVSNGRFAFGVGVAAPAPAPITEGTAGPAAATILAVLRFVLLAGLLIGIGLAAGALLAVRAPAIAPVSMLEFGSWLTVAFVAFVDVRVQSAITGETLIATLNTRYGVLHIVLMIGALLAAIAVSGGRRRWELLIVAAIAALVSESLGGHAATGAQPIVGVVADCAHVLAAAVWIGVLLSTLICADVIDVRRVSNIATSSVVVLVLTGVKAVLQNVASPAALVTTSYGLEICAKIVLLGVALAFAFGSRRRVDDGAVAVARTVRLEVFVLTLVIAVTAVLVDSQPPR